MSVPTLSAADESLGIRDRRDRDRRARRFELEQPGAERRGVRARAAAGTRPLDDAERERHRVDDVHVDPTTAVRDDSSSSAIRSRATSTISPTAR